MQRTVLRKQTQLAGQGKFEKFLFCPFAPANPPIKNRIKKHRTTRMIRSDNRPHHDRRHLLLGALATKPFRKNCALSRTAAIFLKRWELLSDDKYRTSACENWFLKLGCHQFFINQSGCLYLKKKVTITSDGKCLLIFFGTESPKNLVFF